jgi:hypothetical protein
MNSKGYVVAAVIAVVLVVSLLWLTPARSNRHASDPVASSPTSATGALAGVADGTTTVYAHNLRLRKGPTFQVYVRWLRGRMLRTRAGRNPSLDDQDSFVFEIDKGVIHVNIGDIQNYLNTSLAQNGPLKNIKVSGEGNELKLSGTVHKLLMPLPVEIKGTLSPAPDGRIHLHVTKIDVLKMPVKALMGGLKLDIKGVVGSSPVTGVEAVGDDLYLNTTSLLPPPHIRGKLTSVTMQTPDVVVIYGNTENDEAELAHWHNFLRLRGGTVGFGKLSMSNADLTLIDASNDAWFDLDLAKYQTQLVKGYSRMTAEGGLEMYMPDIVSQSVSLPNAVPLTTLKDRNLPLPAAPVKK